MIGIEEVKNAMSKIEDGGPVFPGPFSGHCGKDGHAEPCPCYVDQGMSLRDLFAASALMGLLAGNAYGPSQNIADKCYQHADNMLKARAGDVAQKR